MVVKPVLPEYHPRGHDRGHRLSGRRVSGRRGCARWSASVKLPECRRARRGVGEATGRRGRIAKRRAEVAQWCAARQQRFEMPRLDAPDEAIERAGPVRWKMLAAGRDDVITGNESVVGTQELTWKITSIPQCWNCRDADPERLSDVVLDVLAISSTGSYRPRWPRVR